MKSTTSYPRFELITGDKKARLELLSDHGGIINALVFTDEQGTEHNVIEGFDSLEAIEQDRYYRGIPLYPFVNRLDAGRYTLNGRTYEFPVNETERNNALHGFIQHLPVTISSTHMSSNRAQARAVYDYTGNFVGYPFPARITMTYTLDSSGSMDLEIAVQNLSEETVPVGIGWHPYFTLGEPVNNLLLRLPACKQVLVDDRLLPTGALEPMTSFASLTPIESTFFDTCYALDRDEDTLSVKEVVLWSERLQRGLAIWQTSGPGQFNFIQVCVPPERNSIAVEPVSCGINAFNTQEGLSYLQPGIAMAATCGVRWIQSL
ncbi:MAG TPA: aldose epimerase [Cellvibrionaceae bacterium]